MGRGTCMANSVPLLEVRSSHLRACRPTPATLCDHSLRPPPPPLAMFCDFNHCILLKELLVCGFAFASESYNIALNVNVQSKASQA